MDTAGCVVKRVTEKMAAGLRGQDGDIVRALAGREYRPESVSAQNRRLAMEGRNVWDLPNSTKIVCLKSVQMAVGLRGQVGDNARDLAGQDCKPGSGSAQTRHPVMVERNVWDLLNNIRIVYFIDAQLMADGQIGEPGANVQKLVALDTNRAKDPVTTLARNMEERSALETK